MAYLRDTAFLLRVTPYREHDAWVSLYGKEQGKLEAVIRGYRRPTSKQGPHLRPWTPVEVMIAHGKAIDSLAVIKMRPGASSVPSLAWAGILGSFSSLIHRLVHPGTSDERLFALLEEALALQKSAPQDVSFARSRLIHGVLVHRLAVLLGYGSSFRFCVSCRDEAVALHTFDRALGGFLCFSCEATRGLRRSPLFQTSNNDLLKLVRHISSQPLPILLQLTATKLVLHEAALLFENTFSLLPLSSEPFGVSFLQSVLAE
jgi:DNA repair protein RecO (recombination protein O)